MTATPRRMSLPPIITDKEGERIPVPEGGELVCIRNASGRLVLKIEYSRDLMVKLSSSIFCHQRPPQLAVILEEHPELLGLPREIPSLPSQDLPLTPFLHKNELTLPIPASPLRIYCPFRGPVTPANEKARSLSKHLNKRLAPLPFETPSRAIEIRNPTFT